MGKTKNPNRRINSRNTASVGERRWTPLILIIVLGILIYLICTFTGCKPTKVIVERRDTIRESVIEYIPRDTTFILPMDSSSLKALIECRGNVAYLTGIINYKPGQNIKPPAVSIQQNVLSVECKIDSIKVVKAWNEKHVTTVERTNTVVVKKENYLTGWQWFQLWTGRILGGIVLLVVIFWILKKYLKLQIPLLK
jgi:hypothetical protein